MTGMLLERFVRSFPKQFLVRLSERQQSIYHQSIAMASTEAWTAAEAASVLPHIRRGFWESELRKVAVECGLRCFDMPFQDGESSTYVLVKARGMILTAHYVDGPHQFVREAESRKQNAAVNSWVNEHTNENLLLHPLPRLGTKPIYLNLLHGAFFMRSANGSVGIETTSCFLHLAIPEEAAKRYLYNWSAQEILLAYDSAAETAAGPHVIEDKATPRTKKAQQSKAKRSGQE